MPKSDTAFPPTARILQVDPNLLVFSSALTAVPMMNDVASRFLESAKADLRQEGKTLADEIDALHLHLDDIGIQEPIPVTFTNGNDATEGVTAWDGRHRTAWAIERCLDTVPVRVVSRKEGHALLEGTVIGRRHWTKGQRAWLAVTLHPQVVGNTKGRPGKSDSVGITAQSLADRFGVSADLIDQAVKIHRVFEQLPTLREKHEPGIWIGHGLGAVLAGIPGATTTEDKPKKQISWTTMQGPLSTLSNVAKSFGKWSTEERDCARDALGMWLKQLPADFRLTLTEAVAQSAEGEDDE
ncbi:hypothetical protein [Prosthecobacter sp.]|jgi:hypothetical protein|uniref:hypothetical protein n=1 Tax=Prosthecobacter sp. TaxID=1965333 RepID=UPI0037C6A1F1